MNLIEIFEGKYRAIRTSDSSFIDIIKQIINFDFIWKCINGFSFEELKLITDTQLLIAQDFRCKDGARIRKWKYMPNSTALENGGTIVVTSTGKRIVAYGYDYITPEHFGAIGDGINDDTVAIDNALSYISNNPLVYHVNNELNNSVILQLKLKGLKNYRYTGLGFDYNSANINIEGDGVGSTRFKIESDIFLLRKSNGLGDLSIKGIKFIGGKGVFKHSRTEQNVSGTYIVENCGFYDYTKCAVGFNSSDMPYVRVINNTFFGTSTSIGLALPEDSAVSSIENNKFLKNKFHIKANDGGRGLIIENNDFIRFDNSFECIDIWLIPNNTPTSGNYGKILKNKFGNENLRVQDCRILIADEKVNSGEDFSTRNDYLKTESNGILQSFSVYDNVFYGVTGYQNTIVSYTKKIRDCAFENLFAGAFPDYFFFIDNSINVDDGGDSYTTRNNLIRIKNLSEGSSTNQIKVCNRYGLFTVIDENQFVQNQHGVANSFGAMNSNGVNFLVPINTKAAAIQVYPNGTDFKSQIIDSIGGDDAFELTASEIYSGCNIVFANNAIPGKPIWIEFDIKKGSILSLDEIRVRINRNSDNLMCFSKFLKLQEDWRRVRFVFIPREPIKYKFEIQTPSFIGGVKKTFCIGRLSVYQSNEPIQVKSRNYNSNLYLENDFVPDNLLGYSALYIKNNRLKMKDSNNNVVNLTPISGIAVLSGGMVVVPTTEVNINSSIKLTVQENGQYNGRIRVSARSVGASFTISSSDNTDNCSVAWEIIN